MMGMLSVSLKTFKCSAVLMAIIADSITHGPAITNSGAFKPTEIPLMFIVFLPAVENLKPQWREASEGLGGSSKDYWFRIGFPVLFPSFLGGLLLLFVNSFSAYATAAALISQGTIIAPLSIGNALSSETGGASAPLAKTLSLYMVLVVIIVMGLYTLLRKRVSKWEQ